LRICTASRIIGDIEFSSRGDSCLRSRKPPPRWLAEVQRHFAADDPGDLDAIDANRVFYKLYIEL
jgi:hypothetical protein